MSANGLSVYAPASEAASGFGGSVSGRFGRMIAKPEDKMKPGFWTFVIGVAAGAAAALIFAPQSGEEAQKLIANEARHGVDHGSKAVQSAATKGAHVLQKIRELAAETLATGRMAYAKAALPVE
jgi:hypothetical protein